MIAPDDDTTHAETMTRSHLSGILILLVPLQGACDTASDDRDGPGYRAALLDAAADTAATPELRVNHLDLGDGRLYGDTLRLTLHNRTGEDRFLAVETRTVAGLWFRGGLQPQHGFTVPAHDTLRIAVPYTFRQTSPEARMRVRVGPGVPREGWVQLTDVVFEEWYDLGEDNPTAWDPYDDFVRLEEGPLELWAWRGSRAEADAREIMTERLEAMHRVAAWLYVSPPDRVRLVLYPDAATKARQTRHRGTGYAYGMTLVEIYNDSVRMDPVHELAHIVAGPLGEPPALLSEGFAVYVAERLGADALRFLGAPGRTVDERACSFARDERFPLAELLGLTEIGSDESRPLVSYPQSASVAKHLVETYGMETFREAFRTLRASADAADRRANVERFEALYGPVEDVERAWLEDACGG